jgi:crotonobetainyl-CoA:carnitine CoA-transferase CaiB-like acyl-CoA transferase
MTGYGQGGPLAGVAGHDINYIAASGVLGASARAGERPHFALNLVGDYGGGATLLAFGIVCGVLEARSSGRGQVIDAAMVDGAALLTTLLHGMRAGGRWSDDPGTNLLDSGWSSRRRRRDSAARREAARPAGDDEDAALASWGLGVEERLVLQDSGALKRRLAR